MRIQQHIKSWMCFLFCFVFSRISKLLKAFNTHICLSFVYNNSSKSVVHVGASMLIYSRRWILKTICIILYFCVMCILTIFPSLLSTFLPLLILNCALCRWQKKYSNFTILNSMIMISLSKWFYIWEKQHVVDMIFV